MVFYVFVFGVMAGMATAALLWAGASSGAVVGGMGILFLLCALLSSAVATTLASGAEGGAEEPGLKTGKPR